VKKEVTYDYSKGVLQHDSGGVLLWPMDHPDKEHVSNQSYVLTSKVLHLDVETGIVETLNTVYKPNKNDAL